MTRRKRFQHGSIEKRGKRLKVWYGRWWEDEIGADGKVVRVRRAEVLGTLAKLPTRSDAERMLSLRLAAVNGANYRPQIVWTLRSFIEDQWLPEVWPTIKLSTQQQYRYITKVHILPALGKTLLHDISREQVQSLLSNKFKSGLSWKTVKHIRTVFGTVMQAAVMNEIITSNPVLKTKMPRQGLRAEKAPIVPEQVKMLIDALPEPSHSVATLLAHTGLRVGEALALRWCDINLEAATLQVKRSVYEGVFDTPKTARSRRTVPLNVTCLALLSRLKRRGAEPEELIFASMAGTPLSRRNLMNRQMKPTCIRLNMPEANWHWLRHAHATLLDSQGTSLGTVRDLLGHATAEITREVYIHSVPANSREAVGKLDGLIGSKRTLPPEIALGSKLVN